MPIKEDDRPRFHEGIQTVKTTRDRTIGSSNPLTLAAGLLLAWGVLLSSAGAGLQQLESRIQNAIDRAGLKNSPVSVSVRDVQTGRELVEIRDERPMIPASNMKIYTSAAALQVLGTDHTFQTSFILEGDRLWVVGSGDPGLGDPVVLEESGWTGTDGADRNGQDVEALLDEISLAIQASGVTQLREIVVDDRIFDREHVHPDWPRDQLDKRYCAEVAGMNFALNVLHLDLRPGRDGTPTITAMIPRMPWLVPGEQLSMSPRKNTAIGVRRSPGRNDLVIYGNVAEPVGADVTLSKMPLNFARLLQDRLTRLGVTVEDARIVALTEAAPTSSQKDTREILRISTPISRVVERCNTNSQNLHAESLLKSVGHAVELSPGSWENGARAVRMLLVERLGPEHAEAFRQADGSGMSRNNRITAETTTAWLASFTQDPELGPLFTESLADPNDTGTIKRRFDDLPAGVELACKTGYIRGVSCLSGVLSTEEGHHYAFSILCNEIPSSVGVSGAKRLQERIVDLLAGALLSKEAPLGGD